MSLTLAQITEQLRELKVVPVIALERSEDILPLADTLANHGLLVAEITFRSSAASEAIRLLRQQRPDFLIAAGTVLNAEQVVAAKKKTVGLILWLHQGLIRKLCNYAKI